MKMYILIKDTVPLGLAMAAIGHGVLACYLAYQADSDMQVWLKESYKKVVCKVNEKKFENAKLYAKSVVMTESVLDNKETAIVFCPRPDADWPKPFNFYQLYSRTVMSITGS